MQSLREHVPKNAEKALSSALAQLEEHQMLLEALAKTAAKDDEDSAAQYQRRTTELSASLEKLRPVINELTMRTLEEPTS